MIEKINLYLDTEFNGFGGELISLALVSPEGHEFYEVLEITSEYDPWVLEHVVPILNQSPIPRKAFQKSLEEFLNSFTNPIKIIADWPEDFKLLFDVMITGPGLSITTPRFIEFLYDRDLPNTAFNSKLPHNALEDARSLARFH